MNATTPPISKQNLKETRANIKKRKVKNNSTKTLYSNNIEVFLDAFHGIKFFKI